MVSQSGTLRWTFPQSVPHTSQPLLLLFPPLCRLRPPDVTQQLLRVILDAFCKDHVKYPQHLTGYRHHQLHLFERVFLLRPVILLYLPELCILSHQQYRGLVQHIPPAFPSTVADTAFSIMLALIICHNGISCKLP